MLLVVLPHWALSKCAGGWKLCHLQAIICRLLHTGVPKEPPSREKDFSGPCCLLLLLCCCYYKLFDRGAHFEANKMTGYQIRLLIQRFLLCISNYIKTFFLTPWREYVNRIILYGFQVWSCQYTGKTNLKYGEAVMCEEQALKKLESFPKYFEKPVLWIVHHSKLVFVVLI